MTRNKFLTLYVKKHSNQQLKARDQNIKQHLFFRNQKLEDNMTLAYCNIHNQDSILMKEKTSVILYVKIENKTLFHLEVINV